MSEFKCEVVKAVIEPHPNADAIEICRIGDFQSIVKKGQVKTGDLCVYIPEQAVLPEWLLKDMGFWDDFAVKGELHGGAGNRVKAQKIRGVVSQGLILTMKGMNYGYGATVTRPPIENDGFLTDSDGVVPMIFEVGDDVAEFLGITKYEPALPSQMRGKIVGVDFEATHGYDFDNLKNRTSLFDDGDIVVITEKIHGTLLQIGIMPASHSNEKFYDGRIIITSKGMGKNGFILDHNDETNLYAQACKRHGLLEKAQMLYGEADAHERPIFIFGEVFGKTMSGANVQDLTYTDEMLDYRCFDICIGNRGNETFYNWNRFFGTCLMLDIPTVPVLHIGPYSKEMVLSHTDGNTTMTSRNQIREGVVVKSYSEDRHPHYGRKIAKSVSNAYLLRKNPDATEFN